MRRAVTWLAAALVIWWIVHDPASAGLAVHHLGSFATRAAGSLSAFMSSI